MLSVQPKDFLHTMPKKGAKPGDSSLAGSAAMVAAITESTSRERRVLWAVTVLFIACGILENASGLKTMIAVQGYDGSVWCSSMHYVMMQVPRYYLAELVFDAGIAAVVLPAPSTNSTLTSPNSICLHAILHFYDTTYPLPQILHLDARLC